MSDRIDFVTPSERTAIVTLALARGKVMTPADVMQMTECAERTAYDVLERLSRVIPLCEDGGRWSLLRDGLSLNIE